MLKPNKVCGWSWWVNLMVWSLKEKLIHVKSVGELDEVYGWNWWSLRVNLLKLLIKKMSFGELRVNLMMSMGERDEVYQWIWWSLWVSPLNSMVEPAEELVSGPPVPVELAGPPSPRQRFSAPGRKSSGPTTGCDDWRPLCSVPPCHAACPK